MEASPPPSPSPASSPGRPAKPRLFIREMVLRNFKSYAGEQRIGPFHKSFSAVVGPNGSGKSNVIDAMLFVFGKRAKQMRLNKVSELIHNSSNHQNLDSAGVSVHFQEIIDLDGGNYKVVEGSDFSITRVAFRDNTSRYYINNRGSNFTEVTKVLKGKGVDLDNNRFLILQGEVEQISLMKPKAQSPHDEGFLEYLEDIIGTNQYVEKIEEANKQLEVLNEKRTASVQMLKLAEKERDSLENAKNEAEAYMLKELLLLKWQEKATTMASDDATSHVTQLEENVTDLAKNLTSEREKIKQNSQELKEMEKAYNKRVKKQEELENNMKACKDQFKEFERKDVKHREDLKHLKQKIKKLEDKAEKDTSKIEGSTKEIEESSNLIPQLEEEIPKLQERLNQEEKVLEQIKQSSREEAEKLLAELAQVRTELEPWENQIIEHKGRLDVASGEKQIMKQKHDGARAELTDAQNQMEVIKEKIKTKDTFITELQGKIEKHQSEASEARKVEQECLKQEESLIPLEKAARQKVVEIKSTRDSEKNHGTVLKAILQAKESKEIDGIYGRLGDLGAIDAKYDVAISTACHGLDYIVVETTNSAQACVELLRRRNLGIATFMILEKQAHHLRKLQEKVKTPEGVPRLFDLVKVKDEKLKLGFFATLGNTVVAKDLDQATRIAYTAANEFRRVVTLDGALFEKSGTMSGGGGKPRGGKMGTSIRESVSDEAVMNAENDLNKLIDQLSRLHGNINDAKKRYRSLEDAKSRLEMELAKAKKEVESLNAQYIYNEKRLASLEAASNPKDDEIGRMKELDEIISTEQVALKKLEKSSSKLKDQASELQQKIENAGGQVLKDQKAKVEKIQSELDKTSSDINRHKVKIATCEKMMKKLAKAVEEAKKETENLLAQKEKLMSVFKEIEKKAFLVQEDYKKTQEMIDTHKEELDKTKEDYNKTKKVVDELRATEVDAEYKLQDTKKLAKEWEMKVKAYKKRLADIQTNLAKHMDQLQKDAIDPEKLKETGRVYTVVVVNCTFSSAPNADNAGGRLVLNAYYGPSPARYERIEALEEAPGGYDEAAFRPPHRYDYLYCGSSLYGDLSAARVREWMAYHARFFGARSHFVFHDAGGVGPAVRAALEPWVRAGRATLQDVRAQADYDGWYHNQFLVVNDCLHRYRHAARWTFFFDVDEYIFLPDGRTLDGVLAELDPYTQFTIEQNPMSSRLCARGANDSMADYSKQWGFEKLVFRNSITGVRRDRKYAIQAKNAYATGVHMSENVIGNTTHKTEHLIRYYHYHNTINVPGELCREIVPVPPKGGLTWSEKTPWYYDDSMKLVANAVREFEKRNIGNVRV